MIDVSPTRDCACLAARRRARAITRHFERYLRPHGLRATQFSILAALALAGPKAIGALAGLLGLERTTLTRGAAVLEERGLIGHDASEDNREHRLRLTPAGRRRLESAYPAWKDAQDDLASAFPEIRPARPRQRSNAPVET